MDHTTLSDVYFYTAFGLRICSDLPFVELSASPPPAEVDIYIYSALLMKPSEEIRQEFTLNNPNAFSIKILNGNKIIYDRAPHIDDDSLRLYLLGSAMGALLQQRQYIVLHGNAISFDSKTCTIFVGHSGAGKSTTAAWCYQQGAMILADDVCAITFDQGGTPCVIPSYPQLKLWQETANLLGISTEHLRRVRPNEQKYQLPISKQFLSNPLPIKKIIELSDENREISSAHEKLKLLKTHSYRYEFMTELRIAFPYMNQLLRLASHTTIAKNTRPVLSCQETKEAINFSITG
jgi:hypothetical protein